MRTAAALLAALLAGAPLAGAPLAGATQFQAFDRGTQVRASELIVLGRVVDVRSGWNESRSAIVTDAGVRIDEVWKGLPDADEIVVRSPGGTVDGVELVVEGAARLRRGETVVLFLEREGARWRPWGMAFGKYAVEGKGDGAFVVGSLPPSVAGAQHFQVVSAGLDELRREVGASLEGGLR